MVVATVMGNPDPVETAWRVHSAQVDWTGKVDSKASFALAIQSAVIGGIIGLAGDDRRLANLEGFWPTSLFWAGILLLVLSLIAVSFVVRPRLRSRKVASEAPDNFIFFGHLRTWNAEALEKALLEKDVLPVLSRQIIAMSQVAWMKHRLLQVSMSGGVIGTALVALAAWLN